VSVITLPAGVHPNDAKPTFVTFGGPQRPVTGGKATSVERMGDRYRVAFTLPPLDEAAARLSVSRLLRAKRQGIRVEYPLAGEGQGAPGAAVVDGSDQSGRAIKLRGLTPGYAAKEGFWLTIFNADDVGFLHNVAAQTIAGADGKMTLPIEPMLREPFDDGARVVLSVPTIEGLVDDAISWQVTVDDLIVLGFTVEEAG
jgi:hypothetical protein